MDQPTVKGSPAFQFYPKDFLADENVRVMSLQERGAYITLLSLCWIEGTLPADVDRLARLCGVPTPAFKKLWPALEPCFRVAGDRDGRLLHPRLEREREKQRIYNRRQSDNGRKGGRPRKPTDNPLETQNNPTLSSGLSETKPKKSSAFAVCSLQSSDCSQESVPAKPRAVQGPGAGAGTYPRDHLRCLPPCGRVCFPDSLLPDFVKLRGGDGAAADAYVLDWKARVLAAWDVTSGARGSEPIGDNRFDFWRARWREDHGTTATTKPKAKTLAETTESAWRLLEAEDKQRAEWEARRRGAR